MRLVVVITQFALAICLSARESEMFEGEGVVRRTMSESARCLLKGAAAAADMMAMAAVTMMTMTIDDSDAVFEVVWRSLSYP